jgi:hypothetical protein
VERMMEEDVKDFKFMEGVFLVNNQGFLVNQGTKLVRGVVGRNTFRMDSLLNHVGGFPEKANPTR